VAEALVDWDIDLRSVYVCVSLENDEERRKSREGLNLPSSLAVLDLRGKSYGAVHTLTSGKVSKRGSGHDEPTMPLFLFDRVETLEQVQNRQE
jgi:hypothetical protein